MRARFVVLVAAAAAVACGTLTGVAPAPTTDGGPDGGSVEGGSSDGGSPGARFCDAFDAAAVCSDFDEPDAAAFADGWDPVVTAGDGADASAVLRTGEDLAKSPPRSLYASTTALSSWGSQNPVARLRHPIGTSKPKRVRVTFDVLFEGLDTPGTTASVAEIYWQDCGVQYDGVWVFLQRKQLALYANSDLADGGAIDVDMSNWHHVVLDGDWSSARVTLTVDGVPVQSTVTPPCLGATPYEIEMGSSLQAPSGSVTLRYDNVVVELDPKAM